jgi:hypothetical protein
MRSRYFSKKRAAASEGMRRGSRSINHGEARTMISKETMKYGATLIHAYARKCRQDGFSEQAEKFNELGDWLHDLTDANLQTTVPVWIGKITFNGKD